MKASPTPAVTAQDLRVPMSDGAHLAVHRYPAPDGRPAPIVLMMTPYMKEGQAGWARAVNAHGYEVLIADVRGINGSRAPYQGIYSEREITDGAELVEWAAAQPFSTGAVGLGGASYCGGNQLLIAARRPQGLRCIAPTVSPVDTYRDMFHRGAIPTHPWWGIHTYLPSRQPDTLRDGLVHFARDILAPPCDDDGHRQRSPERVLGRIACPVLCLGGWHDYFLRGTIRVFNTVDAPKRLVVGPWGHCESDCFDELMTWYDHWLRGLGPDPTVAGRVRLFRTGAEVWEQRDGWVDTTRLTWRGWSPCTAPTDVPVHANNAGLGQATNVKAQYLGDSAFGMSTWAEDEVFDDAPVAVATDLTGPVGLRLMVTSRECCDLDLRVRISAVAVSGVCRQLVESRLRASHRRVDATRSLRTADGTIVVPWHVHDREEPLVAGEPTPIEFEIDPLCHRLAPGERLRLGIACVRADDVVAPSSVTIEADTRVLWPEERS